MNCDKKGQKGQSLDHKALINTIASIRTAELRALWTDDLELLPEDPSEAFWWEVWLPVRGERQAAVNDFRKLATLSGCEVSAHQSNFPERTIVLMHGSQNQLEQSVTMLNCVAELRRAKDTAEFFDESRAARRAGLPAALCGRLVHGDSVDWLLAVESA